MICMNLAKAEKNTILKALDLLIDNEEDTVDYTDLILKLRGYEMN